MSKTDIRYSIDLANPPPLTPKQKAVIEALKNMRDEDIDYSDIPQLDEKFWSNARHHPMFKVVKSSTTVRIDADVIAWLKSYGKGYQTRINAILRSAMLEEKRKK
jgi:uncharacterized protein (DUF4415 family)